MSFRGFWFNKFNQKYITYKYPHCYVGIIQELEEGNTQFWGNYSKLFDNGVFWGDYSRGVVMDHTIRVDDCVRSTVGSNWDVYIEKDWHLIDPHSVRDYIRYMCDASYNLIEPGDVAITLFYKAVVPTFAFSAATSVNSLAYNGTYNGVSSLNNGSVIGTPSTNTLFHGGNSNRRAILSINTDVVKDMPEYDLPPDNILNNTDYPIDSFPDGNNILNAGINTSRVFDKPKNVREVDASVNFNASFEFLCVNQGGGSHSKMLQFSYDVAPTASKKASYLSYNVNHHIEIVNVPSIYNEDTVYMMPELFKPFMMIAPNTGGNTTSGHMALMMVFGVKQFK